MNIKPNQQLDGISIGNIKIMYKTFLNFIFVLCIQIAKTSPKQTDINVEHEAIIKEFLTAVPKLGELIILVKSPFSMLSTICINGKNTNETNTRHNKSFTKLL